MSTSANSIFHYTSRISHLEAILRHGFFPSYCKETIITGQNARTFAIPIISFCDIPLSQVREHMKKYGSYAIGMNLDWAVRNGLNPVLYLERDAAVNNGLMKGVMDFLYEDWHDILDEDDFTRFYDGAYKGAISVMQSVKNYSGPLIRESENLGNYKFYDEREWRYIPKIHIDHVTDYPDIFWEEDFDAMQKQFPSKPHFNQYGLPVTADDIRHLIVNDEKELPGIISCLDKFTHLYTSDIEYKTLLTKIKTAKQIMEDY